MVNQAGQAGLAAAVPFGFTGTAAAVIAGTSAAVATVYATRVPARAERVRAVAERVSAVARDISRQPGQDGGVDRDLILARQPGLEPIRDRLVEDCVAWA